MGELKKIQASTIIESIVAMVIITISLGIALVVLSNIIGKNNPQLKFKAYAEAQNAMNNSLSSGFFQDEEWQKEGMHLEKRVVSYQDYDNLRILEVKVVNNFGRILIFRKEIVRIPQ